MRAMTRNSLTPADRLVLQAICESPDGVLFGAKKLQKLLFMAHHPSVFELTPRRALRSFRFKVFKHGPFSEEIYGSLKRLEDEGLVEIESRDLSRATSSPVSPEDSDEDSPAAHVRVYRAKRGADEELLGADDGDRSVVRSAVKRWGWLTGEQLEELVLIRTGLTYALKARYAGTEWSAFEKQAADELPKERPEPPAAFWRAQQQFFKERATLMREAGVGKFAAYIGVERVGIGDDEIALYKWVRESRGQPPDYIGFVSETGRERADALRFG